MSHCPGEGKGCRASQTWKVMPLTFQDSVFHVGDVSAFPKCFSETVVGALCFPQIKGVLVLWLRSKIRLEAGFKGDLQVALETPRFVEGQWHKGFTGSWGPSTVVRKLYLVQQSLL